MLLSQAGQSRIKYLVQGKGPVVVGWLRKFDVHGHILCSGKRPLPGTNPEVFGVSQASWGTDTFTYPIRKLGRGDQGPVEAEDPETARVKHCVENLPPGVSIIVEPQWVGIREGGCPTL